MIGLGSLPLSVAQNSPGSGPEGDGVRAMADLRERTCVRRGSTPMSWCRPEPAGAVVDVPPAVVFAVAHGLRVR